MRAGKQRGALPPPLSGVYRLQNPPYSRGSTGRLGSTQPPRPLPPPHLGVGYHTGAAAPSKLVMGQGAGVCGRHAEVSLARSEGGCIAPHPCPCPFSRGV